MDLFLPSCERDVLDAAADDVSLGDGDDVGHAIAGVDHRARQGSLRDLHMPHVTRHVTRRRSRARTWGVGASIFGDGIAVLTAWSTLLFPILLEGQSLDN